MATHSWVYNGTVNIYNHETETLTKAFNASMVPIQCVCFIAHKNWLVAKSGDFQLCVFNYNTHNKVASFEAHPDYIRCLAVHPTASIVLTGSDDMAIKAWDWDKQWKNIQVCRLFHVIPVDRLCLSGIQRTHALRHEYCLQPKGHKHICICLS